MGIDVIQSEVRWQRSRVLPTGEITMAGNARVHPGGESFLGKEKRVDVAHSVEAFVLASSVARDAALERTARRVIEFYRSRKQQAAP